MQVTDADNSTITIIKHFDCLELPIELLHFNAREQDGRVHLEWATASELNNEYFAIERAGPNYGFREIGRVPGAGTSSVTLDYAFTDDKPLAGLNYYRLKQVDYDGNFAYSPVQAVTVGASNILRLAPVPVADELRVAWEDASEARSHWYLYNDTGRQVGEGTLEPGITSTILPVQRLEPGTYFLRIVQDRAVLHGRFLKR